VAIALTDADIGGEARDDASRRALSCGDGEGTTTTRARRLSRRVRVCRVSCRPSSPRLPSFSP
jgi:hypothetical protein